jgi:hypothetical protein
MPIDDALGELKDIPEHLLKEPVSTFPKTIKELQKMYEDKFKIYVDSDESIWLNIEDKYAKHKDVIKRGGYSLGYSIDIKRDKGAPLKNCIKTVYLFNNLGVFQRVFKKNDEFRNHAYERLELPDHKFSSMKLVLEEWFDESEEFFLKELPELNDFVENYSANR